MKFLIILTTLGLGACTGQRTMYDNNGVTIIQVGADPTAFNGGYNILVREEGGISTVMHVTSTPTVAQQIAMPAAVAGGQALRRPDTTTSSTTVNGGGASSTAAGGKGGRGGNATGGSSSSGSSSNSGASATNNNSNSNNATAGSSGGGGWTPPGHQDGHPGNGNK